MAVVTRAMMTIIANTAGVMTPRLSPMFRMTSSISPRVFISAPMTLASRQGIPHIRPARADPPNLPAQATSKISPV
jgi:hypothetical protein